MSEEHEPADEPIPEEDIGPYGLRGEHTPPLASMFGGYAIIFMAIIVIPFLLFLLIRFVIL